MGDARYLRQVMTAGVGLGGQARIAAAHVVVVGAGGLGTHVAAALWSAGVAELRLYDGDVVEASNLARQIRYGTADIGRAKVEVLRERLLLNRDETGLGAFAKTIDAGNADAALRGVQVVCDCTDNAEARLLLDEACARLGVPLVYGAVRGWIGYVAVFGGRAGVRLADVFSAEQLRDQGEACDVAGVLGTTCGVVGGLQASEALKVVLGEESKADGGLVAVDLRGLGWRVLALTGGGSGD